MTIRAQHRARSGRDWRLRRTEWPGLAVLAAIAAVVLLALAALLWEAAGVPAFASLIADPYVRRITAFTLWQAALSTLLSLAFGLPLALSLARFPAFCGRRALLLVFSLPMALPSLVAVLGIISVFGHQGWLNDVAELAGVGRPLDIYGLPGILIAHVFFNGPLVARLLLTRLEAVPAETWRLAAQLGLPPASVFAHIEWPAARSVLPGIAAVVFMLCVTSFTIVLTLGGGPAATTLEVAIYQSLRFDFEPARAVALALLQLVLSGTLAGLAMRLSAPMTAMAGIAVAVRRPDTAESRGGAWIAAHAAIAFAALVVLLPLMALLSAGLMAPFSRILSQPSFWQAVMTSVAIATASSLLCLSMAGALAAAARSARRDPAGGRLRAQLYGGAGGLVLLVPPLVLGAGWFVLLNPYGWAFALAPAMVVVVNALMALPFAVRILDGALEARAIEIDRLADSLGITGLTRLSLIDWPLLKAPITFAAALAAALSLGDLGIAALFGSEHFVTLPLLLYQRLGSYRFDDAAGIALVLAVFCLTLFHAGERIAARTRS